MNLQKRAPDAFVILFALILICAAATWFVPGGAYVTADDGTVSFERVSAVPQTWQVFSALYEGFKLAGYSSELPSYSRLRVQCSE